MKKENKVNQYIYRVLLALLSITLFTGVLPAGIYAKDKEYTVDNVDLDDPDLTGFQRTFGRLLSDYSKSKEVTITEHSGVFNWDHKMGKPLSYHFLDVNKEGIPELLVKFGTNGKPSQAVIYKLNPAADRYGMLGEILDFGDEEVYTLPSGNGFVTCQKTENTQRIYKCEFHTGYRGEEVFSETIKKGSSFAAVEDIVKGSKYAPEYDISDLTPVMNWEPQYPKSSSDTENFADVSDTLIDKYLTEAYTLQKREENNDGFTELVNATKFLGPDFKGTISDEAVREKLIDEYMSGNISIPGNGEVIYLNPDDKNEWLKMGHTIYDINQDGIRDFVLLSEVDGEPQIDTFYPFRLRRNIGDEPYYYPNISGDYYVEMPNGNMMIDVGGIGDYSYYEITKFNPDAKDSLKNKGTINFSAIQRDEVGEEMDYELTINERTSSISKEEYKALEKEVKELIKKAKRFNKIPLTRAVNKSSGTNSSGDGSGNKGIFQKGEYHIGGMHFKDGKGDSYSQPIFFKLKGDELIISGTYKYVRGYDKNVVEGTECTDQVVLKLSSNIICGHYEEDAEGETAFCKETKDEFFGYLSKSTNYLHLYVKDGVIIKAIDSE